MSCWTDFMRSLQNRHPLLGSNFKAEILPHHYGKVTGSQWLILRERAILWFYEKSRRPFWAGEQKYNWKSGLIGLFGSKWTSKIISLQPPSIYRGTFHLTRLLQGLSNLLLNTSRSGTSTVCSGKLAQWLTTHRVKNFFQISNLILPFYSLKTFSLTVSLHPLVKSAFPAFLEGLEVLEGSLSSLYPPLLQGEQSEFPQPASSLLGIFVASSGVTLVMGTSELGAVVQLGPYGTEVGENHFPSPAGQVSLYLCIYFMYYLISLHIKFFWAVW